MDKLKSCGVSLTELLAEGVGSTGVVGEEPEGRRVVRTAPANGVDRNAAASTVSTIESYYRCRSVLGGLCADHDEVHLLLLGAVLAVVHEHDAGERALLLLIKGKLALIRYL
mgnify:CR=1 FL=1